MQEQTKCVNMHEILKKNLLNPLSVCLVTIFIIILAKSVKAQSKKPIQSSNIKFSVCVTHSVESLGENRIRKVDAPSTIQAHGGLCPKNRAPLVFYSASLSSR